MSLHILSYYFPDQVSIKKKKKKSKIKEKRSPRRQNKKQKLEIKGQKEKLGWENNKKGYVKTNNSNKKGFSTPHNERYSNRRKVKILLYLFKEIPSHFVICLLQID